MDTASVSYRWIIIAEKLLAEGNIDYCHQVCNEIDLLLADIDDNSSVNSYKADYSHKVNSIRRKLNSIMANEVRQKLKQINNQQIIN